MCWKTRGKGSCAGWRGGVRVFPEAQNTASQPWYRTYVGPDAWDATEMPGARNPSGGASGGKRNERTLEERERR